LGRQGNHPSNTREHVFAVLFTNDTIFDASLFVEIRKRLTDKVLNALNEEIVKSYLSNEVNKLLHWIAQNQTITKLKTKTNKTLSTSYCGYTPTKILLTDFDLHSQV
jgi:hypothetical protein